jgi:hypothetical protein
MILEIIKYSFFFLYLTPTSQFDPVISIEDATLSNVGTYSLKSSRSEVSSIIYPKYSSGSTMKYWMVLKLVVLYSALDACIQLIDVSDMSIISRLPVSLFEFKVSRK